MEEDQRGRRFDSMKRGVMIILLVIPLLAILGVVLILTIGAKGEIHRVRNDGSVIIFQTMQDNLDEIAVLTGKLENIEHTTLWHHNTNEQEYLRSKISQLQNEVQTQLLQQILMEVQGRAK